MLFIIFSPAVVLALLLIFLYKAPSFSPSKIESNNISNITVSSYTSHGFIIKKEKSKVSSNNICLKQTNDSDLEEFYTKQKISQSDIIIHKKLLISEVVLNV